MSEFTVLDWAKIYTEFGLSVFPCHGIRDDGRCTCGKPDCSNAGKHPFTAHGVKDASNDMTIIAKLFNQRTDLNIAISTNNIFVVDIDSGDGISGEDSLKELERQHGVLTPTLESKTARGRHLIYKMPSDFQVKNTTNLAPKIDIRGIGGYVIAPPSKHKSGAQYSFNESSFDAGIANAPEWLLNMLRPKPKSKPKPYVDYSNKDELAEAASAIQAISPDIGYHEWVAVGMALQDKFGSAGFALWDSWSSSGDKYKANETWKKWQSFKNDAGITIATMFDMARLNGWKPEPIVKPEVDTSIVNKIVEEASDTSEDAENRAIRPDHLINISDLKLEGLIDDTIKYILKDSWQPQPLLALLHTLSFAGAVFGRRYESPIGTRTNIYLIGIADTGAGKDFSRKKIALLAEAARLSNFVGSNAIRSDTGIARSLSVNPSQIYTLDEYGKLLQALNDKKAAPHQKALIRLFMQLYSDSGSVYKHGEYADARNKEIVIMNPNLCIYGTTTEEDYAKAISRDAVSSGELNRTIALRVNKAQRVRIDSASSYSPDLVDAWNRFSLENDRTLISNASLSPQPIIVEWGNCKELQWQIALEQDKLSENTPYTGALWNRRHENIIKIAMILAIARNKERPETTYNDFFVAKTIVDTSIKYVSSLVKDNIYENEHERDYMEIIKFIKSYPGRGITKSELGRRFRKLKRKELDEFLLAMIEQEILVTERVGEVGQLATIYRLATPA